MGGNLEHVNSYMPEKSATFKTIRLYYKSMLSYLTVLLSNCNLLTNFDVWDGS